MPEVKILDHNGPVAEVHVESLEKKLGIEVPEDYRQFLTSYNGGRPDPATFNFGPEGDASDVCWFFGVGIKGTNGLEYVLEMFKGRVPDEFLPIARDSGGSLLCININGNGFGKIYFWDREFEEDNDEPTTSNMHFLANSFSEFLTSLYKFIDEEEL